MVCGRSTTQMKKATGTTFSTGIIIVAVIGIADYKRKTELNSYLIYIYLFIVIIIFFFFKGKETILDL